MFNASMQTPKTFFTTRLQTQQGTLVARPGSTLYEPVEREALKSSHVDGRPTSEEPVLMGNYTVPV